jgi:hypothetical protein
MAETTPNIPNGCGIAKSAQYSQMKMLLRGFLQISMLVESDQEMLSYCVHMKRTRHIDVIAFLKEFDCRHPPLLTDLHHHTLLNPARRVPFDLSLPILAQ